MSEHDPSTRPEGPSRRSVVRTAAWSVPAVSVLAAAPAYASSTAPGALLITSAAGVWGGNQSFQRAPLTFTFTVVNTGATALGAVVLRVQLPTGGSDLYYERVNTAPTNGWSAATSDSSSDGDSRDDLAHFTLSTGLAPGATSTFTVVMGMRDWLLGTGNSRQDRLNLSVTGQAPDGRGGTANATPKAFTLTT